jgi:hypothetical protein
MVYSRLEEGVVYSRQQKIKNLFLYIQTSNIRILQVIHTILKKVRALLQLPHIRSRIDKTIVDSWIRDHRFVDIHGFAILTILSQGQRSFKSFPS